MLSTKFKLKKLKVRIKRISAPKIEKFEPEEFIDIEEFSFIASNEAAEQSPGVNMEQVLQRNEEFTLSSYTTTHQPVVKSEANRQFLNTIKKELEDATFENEDEITIQNINITTLPSGKRILRNENIQDHLKLSKIPKKMEILSSTLLSEPSKNIFEKEVENGDKNKPISTKNKEVSNVYDNFNELGNANNFEESSQFSSSKGDDNKIRSSHSHQNERGITSDESSDGNLENSSMEQNFSLSTVDLPYSMQESKYLPSTSIQSFKSENNDTNYSNKTIEIITNNLNVSVSSLNVPSKEKGSKKHFCKFCKTMQTKLSRHLFLKHKNERQVAEAFNLGKNTSNRLKIIEQIRKEGDFEHNTHKDLNTGILITTRRQQTKMNNCSDDYATCPNCMGCYAVRSLRIHLTKCTKNKKKGEITIQNIYITTPPPGKRILRNESKIPENIEILSSTLLSEPSKNIFEKEVENGKKNKPISTKNTEVSNVYDNFFNELDNVNNFKESSKFSSSKGDENIIRSSHSQQNERSITYDESSETIDGNLENSSMEQNSSLYTVDLPYSAQESKNLPSTSIQSFKSENNDTNDSNKTVEIITNNLNVSSLNVPSKEKGTKKHFCKFCKTMQAKLSRHLFLKHKKERQVAEALNLGKKTSNRLKIIEQIRKEGDFEHNTHKDLNTGILITTRRQQTKMNNCSDDYATCPNCMGCYSVRTLRIHLTKCTKNKKKGDRTNLTASKKITQYVHEEADVRLKTRIFPKMWNDEVTRSIRFDELAIKYGNKLCLKFSGDHQDVLIRQQLRNLGNFKLEMSKHIPDLSQLSEVFRPRYHDICMKAVRVLAHWDEDNGVFKTPSTAQNYTSLIKKVAEKLRSEYIKTQSYTLQNDVEEFLILWKEDIPLLNKKAHYDLDSQKRKIVLPTNDDIKVLYNFLRDKCYRNIKELENNFSLPHYIDLTESSLVFIQIFNRRRADEIERLTLENYKNKDVITDDMEESLLNNISKESISFAKQFYRITMRGKLNRTESILLNPICVKSLETVLKYRTQAGISSSNVYLFAKPNVKGSILKEYIRVCPLLRRYAEECGANIPSSLSGTMLRKHIATFSLLLNLEDATVDSLANFMGHNKDIHKEIYRVPVPLKEITCISKLLMDAVGVNEENENEIYSENEENIPDAIPSQPDVTEHSKPGVNRRSTLPYGKIKRTKWTEEERKTIFEAFGNLHELERLPSLSECSDAIILNSSLRNRTPQQIKTWIDNQRRYKKD